MSDKTPSPALSLPTPKNSWRDVWHVYAQTATLRMQLLGFSAGLLLAQAAIMAGLAGMALSDPKLSLETIAWFALLTALVSATQDIWLDAFRVEILERGADAAGRSNRGGHR